MTFKPVANIVSHVNAAVDYLRAWLDRCGIYTIVHHLGERSCLYASTCPPAESPDIIFNAHLDVVPAPDTQFAAREEGGWLIGRGTHDCLGNCAVLASLLRRIKAENAPASIGVMFSTDEEIGGETTALMINRTPAPKRLVVVVDGSGNSITIAQKGVLTVRLTASGQACHAATPWLGDNAIDKLIEGYLRIRNQFPRIAPPDEWHKTMAATVVRSGEASNRVPDLAEMVLNIRYTETDNVSELMAAIKAASGLDAEIESSAPPVFCDPEMVEMQIFIQHMKSCLNRDIAVKRSNGATDARHFIGCNVPIAIIGVNGRGMHGDDEAVEIKSLVEYEKMLVGYLHQCK